jgi:hypothetical protein
MTSPWDFLTQEQHVVKLQSSAISEEVARARGYRSVGIEELRASGFTALQAGAPALFIPLYDTSGARVNVQMRRDAPRLGPNGKPRKYELPARTTPRLVPCWPSWPLRTPSTLKVVRSSDYFTCRCSNRVT